MTTQSNWQKKHYLVGLLLAMGILAIAARVGSMLGAEVSGYAKGAGVYAELGCGACHESLVLPPIERHRKPAPHLFAKWIDTSDLSERIRYGDYKREDYVVAQRSIPRKIKMPAYEDSISESELRALMLFLQVNQVVHMPSTSTGQNLAMKYGCFNCHGPLGLGGVVNPRSLKGYIPGWFGSDFDELTNGGDRETVAEWIEHGTSASITGKSLGRGVLARYYGERQSTKMPSFRRRIPAEDRAQLVGYVLLLREVGDMRLPEVQRYKALYTVPAESSDDRLPEEDETSTSSEDWALPAG